MIKHFVRFYSPGTFCAEMTDKPIDSWDVDKAMSMAHEIHERYNARPYGFRFITRERGKDDLDSKETRKSIMYYLGGVVQTLDDIKAQNNPKNKILIDNMEMNNIKRCITNGNSWQWTQLFNDDDVVLPFNGFEEVATHKGPE